MKIHRARVHRTRDTNGFHRTPIDCWGHWCYFVDHDDGTELARVVERSPLPELPAVDPANLLGLLHTPCRCHDWVEVEGLYAHLAILAETWSVELVTPPADEVSTKRTET